MASSDPPPPSSSPSLELPGMGNPPSRRPSIRSANPSTIGSRGSSPTPGSPALGPSAGANGRGGASGERGGDPVPAPGASTGLNLPSTPPRVGKGSLRRSAGNATASSSSTATRPEAGTFLTRFLGTFRPPSASPARPPLPRSLSSPLQRSSELTSLLSTSSIPSIPAAQQNGALSTPGGPPPSPARSTASTSSLSKRFRPAFGRSKSQAGSPKASPVNSPAASPALSYESPQLSPGSPATLKGRERDPMELAMVGHDSGAGASGSPGHYRTPTGDTLGMPRRGSGMSAMTVQANDRLSTSGSLGGAHPGTPLHSIAEPSLYPRSVHLEHSLELIATLLPPALLLLSQLGPTHLFSPPLQFPSLFDVTLSISSFRKSSLSVATDDRSQSGNSNLHIPSDRASIASTATNETATTATSFLPAHPTTDHLRPSYSHELHAPSTLSVPAVSAAAIWRLFRGFEWIGEVGKGEQPLPPSPNSSSLGGPPLELADEPEQVFCFPALVQGVADVLAADAAARGVELVIGQVGNGSAPSPAATPAVTPMAEGKGKEALGAADGAPKKDTEARELLVRADERAWSVALVWILHHILAGATSGATIEVRFLATAASPPATPAASAQMAPDRSTTASPPASTAGRRQKWWTVSLEILHAAAPPATAVPYNADATPSPPFSHSLPTPPFDSPFARSLFSLVGFDLRAAGTGATDTAAKSWVLEALLPAARPKATPSDEPSSLLGRRRASLEAIVGQEPTMNELKRFAENALKGHRVALHAGEQSTFAKHLTMYLAGWGMDVQHVPLDSEAPLSSGSSTHGNEYKSRPLPNGRFDSGFSGTDAGSPPVVGSSPGSDGSHKSPELGAVGGGAVEPNSNLVIIDDDVSTLRRLLVALRAPPLHIAPTLAATPTRKSTNPWVILHFASLTHYKTIKEIVQDALATSRSPTLPEVLVVPKPAGPRRIITALWTALKRPAVDPFLPPIATSPTSPGIQYWTPRLSPALAKEQEFDFGGDPGSAKDITSGATLGKPRTPPIYFAPGGAPYPTSGLPPSPLGKIADTQDSYFSSVAEELKESTPSEGMVIQSPDGRSGIFFQPQPRSSRSASAKERVVASRPMERDRLPGDVAVPEDAIDTAAESPGPTSRVSTAAPHEIGLGSAGARRIASNSSSHHGSISDASPGPLGTPALTLDSFISAAAKSRAAGEDVSPEELPPSEALARQSSTIAGTTRASASARHNRSGSSGSGGASNAPSPRALVGASSPVFSPGGRRGTASGPVSPAGSPPPATPGGPAAQGAAAAKAQSGAPGSPTGARNGARSRTATVTSMPKNKRKVSRKSTLPTVPPIRVLIVEDNPINQTILSMFMKKQGIKFEVAKDGEQAVEKWQKGNYHLVLMDIQLPVKDGIQATREIREMERAMNVGTFITTPTSDLGSPMSSVSSNPLSAPNSPLLSMPVIIVALTASSLQADRVAALAAGCNDFLTKPVSLPWLQSKLVEWGSMAYLSGFSRKPDPMEPGAPTGRPATPGRSLPQTVTPPSFSEGLATNASQIARHLHIDRSTSRTSSPVDGRLAPAGSSGSTPGVIPESGADLATPVDSSTAAHLINPTFAITSPTPHDTPGTAVPAVPAVPGATDTPAPPAGGDTKQTLDLVENKLEGLVQEQEEKRADSHGRSVPHRPGPTPLPPSVLTAGDPLLDSVVAEGARLAEVGRGRSGSASFTQAIVESGVSSAASSIRGSVESLRSLRKTGSFTEES
ncbi:hypothetical protein JCM1841_000381 [Sporobolomyces salmonicolor]